jgi:hypothetical protein
MHIHIMCIHVSRRNLLKIIMIILLVAHAFLFISCVFAIGDKEKGLKIHKEIPNTASLKIINIKGILTFITGIMYVLAAVGFILNIKNLIFLGSLGAAIFVLFYIYELLLWSKSYPMVWGGFLMFGSVSLFIGIYCFNYFRLLTL